MKVLLGHISLVVYIPSQADVIRNKEVCMQIQN